MFSCLSYFGDGFIFLQKSNCFKCCDYSLWSLSCMYTGERQHMHISQLLKFPQTIIGFWDRTDWSVTWNFCFDHSIHHLMGRAFADVNSRCWLFGYILLWRAPAKRWVIILKWHVKLLNVYIWIDKRKSESNLIRNISIAYLSYGKYIVK